MLYKYGKLTRNFLEHFILFLLFIFWGVFNKTVRYEMVITNVTRCYKRLAGYQPFHIQSEFVKKNCETLECQQASFDATNSKQVKRKETNANLGGF